MVRWLAIWLLLVSVASSSSAQTLDVWIGTGRSGLSKGIYHCTLDVSNGKLSEPALVAEMGGPGFLEKHPLLPILYAVGEKDGEQVVAAFAMGNDSLKFVNALPIGDGGAAHVSLDKTGRTLLTAQYGGGSVAAFSVKEDGSLAQRTELIDHVGGSKAVPGRQDASHAHWTGVSPDNRFAFVPDLGLDEVVIYKLDAASSRLQRHGSGKLPPGSGPRHMKFHPNGRWIYVVNEIALTVTKFDYDAEAGTMTASQTIETVPPIELEREKAKSTAEIRIHPNGKYVYASNRGHDTITLFAIDPTSGQLSFVQREPVRGSTPRNFNVTPDGQWLLAAGQLSNTLALFSIDQASGRITFHQNSVFAPTPICILWSSKPSEK